MKLIVSRIIPKAMMFIALVCLFISCESDEAELDPTLNWTAETTVDENEVAATGVEYAFNRDNRTDIPYKIDHEDLAYKLFTAAGFEWGGDWTSLKDYQHFEIDL